MPSLKYRSTRTEPLAPLGFGSHKLDNVRFRLCGHASPPLRFMKHSSNSLTLSSHNAKI